MFSVCACGKTMPASKKAAIDRINRNFITAGRSLAWSMLTSILFDLPRSDRERGKDNSVLLWFVRLEYFLVFRDAIVEIRYRLDVGFVSVFAIADIIPANERFLLKLFAVGTNDGDRGMQAWI